MVHEFHVGEMVGRYRLDRRLATGGMGCVWKAYDERLARDVAIKLLPRLKVVDSSSEKRFYREARAMGRLHHPRVISVYDIGSVEFDNGEQVPFIVMELILGRGLDRILSEGPLPPRRAVEIMLQVAQALVEAHRAGVVHRDLKPSNIMVTDQGDAKVLDFGLARLLKGKLHGAEATLTAPGMVLGSCPYMAPEQATGEGMEASVDLFSFGAVLYEALAGRRAFRGSTPIAVLQAVVHCRFDPLEDVIPNLPPSLYSIVGKCMEKEAGKRYVDASALVMDLQAFLESEESHDWEIPTVAVDSTPISAHRGRLRRRRIFIAALFTAGLVLGTLGGLFFGRMGHEQIHADLNCRFRRILWRAPGTILKQTTWSPGGTSLVVESHGSEGDQLIEILPENEIRRVLVDDSIDGMPIWPEFSPEGKALAYCRLSETSTSIEIISATGGRPVARMENASRPHWLSEDQVLFSRGGEAPQSIWLWNISNDGLKQVRAAEKGRAWWAATPGPLGKILLLGGNGDARPGLFVARNLNEPVAQWMPGGAVLEDAVWYPGAAVILCASDGQLLAVSRNNIRVMMRGAEHLSYPAFGPEGRQLSVVRSEKNTNLLLVDPSTGVVECLHCDDPMTSWGSRGPDGSIVLSRKGGDRRPLLLEKGGSKEFKELSGATGKGKCPSISPDGERLAFLGNGDHGAVLKVVAISGGEANSLMEGVEGSEFPSWSPDGGALAFAAGSPLRIHVISVVGGKDRVITEDNGDYPAWSPDGRWIAYAIWTDDQDPRQGTWIVHPDGSSPKKISDSPTRVAWSPGGASLYQLRRRADEIIIFRADSRDWNWEETAKVGLDGPAPPHQEFMPMTADPSTGGLVLNYSTSRSDLLLIRGLDPGRWRAMD